MKIEIDNLAYSYEQKQVLYKLSCGFKAGQIHIILGINGAGKSTLIKLINRLLRPQSGRIYLSGNKLSELALPDIARQISYVAQQQQGCELTVTDYIMLGRKPHLQWNFTQKDKKVVFTIIKKLELEALALRPLTCLSGGELQKTIIARALAQQPEVLLLDEPTSNLDLKNQIEVMEIIRKETGAHALTTIVTMHDINLALRYGTSFTLLQNRKVMISGGMEIIDEKNLSRLFGISIRLHHIDNRIVAVPA